jgi:hypothetical protein
VKVVLEPPRKLRKVTLIIEARGACLEKESRLEASLHHTDNSGKEGLKQSLSLGATRYFILTIHSSFTVYSMLIHCLFTVHSQFTHASKKNSSLPAVWTIGGPNLACSQVPKYDDVNRFTWTS